MLRHLRFYVVLTCFLCASVYIGISLSNTGIKYSLATSNIFQERLKGKRQDNGGCIPPKLNPFEGEYAKYFHSVDPVQCAEDLDWVSVSNGSVFISPEAVKKHGHISCKLTYYDRIDDFKNIDKETVDLEESKPLKLKWDFFKVHCTAADKKIYENTHAGIRYVPDLHKKHVDVHSGLGLDVLILGFDSLSHMTYMRKLKKSYKYFMENLQGIVLNGYNIVGDGTPQALIPIFTGKTELELPRTLKRLAKKDFVDVYPLVWKDFQKQGYVTAWGEDCPHIGTFTYRMVGFKNPPTDHYMRTFHVTAHKEYYGKHKDLCLGSKRRSELFLNWIRDFYTMYDKRSKFAFGFHSEVSHGDNNLVETADEDLYNTLKFLNDGNYLRNTLVILMSDHGARFSKLRSTLQGKQEERLPMFGFAFPSWFKTKYSEAFKNFKSNAEKLTTPFDLYPTLRDILNYSGPGVGDINDRGISLFKEIPSVRNCEHAQIETHWCACLNWQTLSEKDTDVIQAAEHVVGVINGFTQPHRKLCAELKIDKVLRAQMLLPQVNMLKFKKTNDADGFNADLSDNTAVNKIIYQIWVYTSPGNGLFEVTLTHDNDKRTFSVDESTISRVNKYGDAPKCIEKEHEELRKYCYCYK